MGDAAYVCSSVLYLLTQLSGCKKLTGCIFAERRDDAEEGDPEPEGT